MPQPEGDDLAEAPAQPATVMGAATSLVRSAAALEAVADGMAQIQGKDGPDSKNAKSASVAMAKEATKSLG